jgi:integrase
MTAYQQALAEATTTLSTIGAGRTRLGSVADVVARYLGSTAYGNLAPSTQRDRLRLLDQFREDYGAQNFATLTPAHVERILAAKNGAPQSKKNFLKVLRAVAVMAVALQLRADDPTLGIKIKTRPSEGFRTWTEEDIARFEAYWPIGSRERLAFALLLYTGQRRGDVIHLGRQHVQNGLLTVRQGKTRAIVVIPLHPELQALLGHVSTGRQMTFLTTATGKPFAPGAFTNWFGAKCREAGLPLGLSAHGLRKAMCRRLAEAGCSTKEIQAVSGHVTLKEVERYAVAADRKRLAANAIATLK